MVSEAFPVDVCTTISKTRMLISVEGLDINRRRYILREERYDVDPSVASAATPRVRGVNKAIHTYATRKMPL